MQIDKELSKTLSKVNPEDDDLLWNLAFTAAKINDGIELPKNREEEIKRAIMVYDGANTIGRNVHSILESENLDDFTWKKLNHYLKLCSEHQVDLDELGYGLLVDERPTKRLRSKCTHLAVYIHHIKNNLQRHAQFLEDKKSLGGMFSPEVALSGTNAANRQLAQLIMGGNGLEDMVKNGRVIWMPPIFPGDSSEIRYEFVGRKETPEPAEKFSTNTIDYEQNYEPEEPEKPEDNFFKRVLNRMRKFF